MKYRLSLLITLASLWLAPLMPAQAQSRAPLPTEVRLTGLQMMWQQYNRCSATALFMQLSYWEYPGSATDIIQWLNPYAEDKSVRLEELIAFAETQGLKGLVRTGGSIALMQALVAAGFPVLVENAYWHRDKDADWFSHNRVLMGYDTGFFYFYDPLLGPGEDSNGYAIRYEEYDRRWHDFNRIFMVLYPPDAEPELQAVLGDYWESDSAARLTLAQAEADYAITQEGLSLYNVASAHLALGDFEQAAQLFDQARAIGLPWRMHWYRFEAFEAYLAVGRYDDVLTLVYEVLENESEIQEVYYYAGRAAEGLGDPDRARANYYAALARNANYPEAQAALDALGG
jgi:tetratricopeptide (TPR) repeat protein